MLSEVSQFSRRSTGGVPLPVESKVTEFIDTESRGSCLPGAGGGRNVGLLSSGVKFQFRKVNSVYRSAMQHSACD